MQRYTRKEKYSIDEVLSRVLFENKSYGKKHKVDFDGDLMNMASQRYQCFKTAGIKCVECGIKGIFFAKEKDFKSKLEIYHFNLYAIDHKGEEVLMTKDHIFPIKKGGLDVLENYQTMCCTCNVKKGSS